MINKYSFVSKKAITNGAMCRLYTHRIFKTFWKAIDFSKQTCILAIFMIFSFSFSAYTQKVKDVLPYGCVKYVGNGLYQASFGYSNPTKKEVVVNENASIVISNNGKRKAKGLNKFKPGSVDKVFTKEFGSKDYVQWTIISNGNEHTITVNANSGTCDPDHGFIFPVYGQGNGKSEEIVGQGLTALAEGTASDNPSDLVFQIDNEKVLIEIVPVAGELNNVIDLLTGVLPSSTFNVPSTDFLLFKENLKNDLAGLAAIDVYFPVNLLLDLNNHSDYINFIRPLYPSIKHSTGDGFTGNAVSQGDATQNSDIVRESFKLIDESGNVLPVDGTGITIGVMSNSFDTQPYSEGNDSKATLDVKAGDLPGLLNTHGYTSEVTVLKEYPYGVASDEGRAMMHILHDIAPGAALAFHTGSLSPRNFEEGFRLLAELSDFIVDDITYITEPFFGEGRVSAAIKEFTDDGKIHVTSAGNFGNKGYQGVFKASESEPVTNFIDQGSPVRAHIFDESSGDYLQKISVKGGNDYMIVLQWDNSSASQDNTTGASIDLDFYIVDDSGRLLVGNNRSNENGDAAEIMVFTANADGEANIMITSANGPTTVPFRYIAFQSKGLTLLEYGEGSPTISGHAMTEESVTVGAIRFNQTEAEVFSSYGGNLMDGNYVSVDFAAPDGVDTNVGSIGIKYFENGVPVDDTEKFPNFFGTSAAAPSATAAMALLQSSLPTWYPDGYPGSIVQLFKDNTKDGSLANAQVGSGMIDVNKVFNTLASQTGRITSFTFPNGDEALASAQPVTIKIIGEFFPVAPAEGETSTIKVMLDDVELTGILKPDGSIEVDIPPFSGNPSLRIYTEPMEGSVGNGGFSEPYKFFQDDKIAITITGNPSETIEEDGSVSENPVTVRFGQEFKSKLSYTIQGIEFIDETETNEQALERLGLPQVVLTTTVDDVAYPDVQNYPVTPSFGGEPYDTELFIVNFKNGDLVIEKNYLTIKPNDQILTYGEVILNDMTYQLTDAEGNPISEGELNLLYEDANALYKLITDAHLLDFSPTNENYLIINDFKALINDWDWQSETNDFKALINEWKALINDWKALINEPNFQIIVEGSSWTTTKRTIENDFKPLINGMNYINLSPSHFNSYSNYLNEFKPLINDFKPLINDFKALINQSEFVGDIYLNEFKPLINDFKPLINDFKPLINDSSGLFTIISTDDAPSPEYPDNEISTYYSINLVTGIHVYEEPHYIIPGSLINAIENNFDITYDPGRLTFNPEVLTIKTENKEMAYGETLSSADLTTAFEGLVNDDKLREVFSNKIPYYFVKIGDEGNEYEIDELKELGTYQIKIRQPQNYTLEYDVDHGKLTILKAAVSVETETLETLYGMEIKATDLTTVFGDFGFGENTSNVFPQGVPYYFEDNNGQRYELVDRMPVGDYTIKIDAVDNYVFNYGENHGFIQIKPAPLVVKSPSFELEYGDSVREAIETFISGFAEGEDLTNIYPLGADGVKVEIPYLFIKGTEDPLNIDTVKDLGTYRIEIGEPVLSVNYEIEYHEQHGTLTIKEAALTFTSISKSIVYGASDLHIDPEFKNFAPLEDESVLYVDGKLPFYFIKDGLVYYPGDQMEVGAYEIFIKDNLDDNYIFSPDNKLGSLSIDKAFLSAAISPVEQVINQGDTPNLTSVFSGFKSGDHEGIVFPAGIPYYFVGQDNTNHYDTGIPGVFDVKIADPSNYMILYDIGATILVNPFNDDIRKVRTYSDCVSYNGPSDYTVTFRYENDNFDPVFVALGVDNMLSGPGAYGSLGELPTVFMPGSGSFEIRFSGEQLVWSLTTYGSTNKSSVSSLSTSNSGECDAKLDYSYNIYPNPVNDLLYIEQNAPEESRVSILNIYGVIVGDFYDFDGINPIISINMSGYAAGMYIVRIQTADQLRTYSILKQ